MGDIALSKAEYTVGTQKIDLLSEMNDELSKNYGELNVVVSALDAKLRKDNRILVPPNDPSLAQNVPKLTIEYTDERGAYHVASSTLTETLHIGERSAFGKIVQKPGDILWSASLVVGQWSMVFIVATLYGLVVLWTLKQWEFMQGKFKNWGDITTARFGPLGYVVGVIIYMLFWIFRLPSDFISPTSPDGWMLKWVVAASSAFAPIPGFLVQCIIWMTVVRNLGKGPAPSPGASIVDAGSSIKALAAAKVLRL